jgi:hypothetical protein
LKEVKLDLADADKAGAESMRAWIVAIWFASDVAWKTTPNTHWQNGKWMVLVP